MSYAYQALLILHVVAMGLWFAYPLSQPRRLRSGLQSSPEIAKAIIDGLGRERMLIQASGAITLLSGIALIFVRGGFAAVPTRYHVALGLVLVMAAQGPLMFARIWKSIEDHMAAGKPPAEAMPFAKRLSMASGIHQLLWFVVLVLMLWRG